MIKQLILIGSLFILPISQAHHDPSGESFSSNSVHIRFFKKLNPYTGMLEIASGNNYDQQTSQLIKVGGYKQFLDGQKLGIFTSLQTGLRHSDDWVKPNNSYWKWQNTSDRSEVIIHLNFEQKFVPYFDQPLVIGLKGEYQQNTFNQNQTFLIKPNLSYFFLDKGAPFLSIHLSTPQYFALNFEKKSLYKSGLYLGLLYHVEPTLQFGLNLETYRETWTDSTDYSSKFPSGSYETSDDISHLKFEVIYQL